MGKKMKFPFLSKTLSDTKPSPSPWQWPSCGYIKTLSFRAAATAQDNIFKTLNSAYFIETAAAAETPHSCFTNSSAESSRSFSTMSEEESGSDQIEMIIRGLRSERLFFKPGKSNSILEEANKTSSNDFGGYNLVPYQESVVLSMESKDPIVDFRRSMEEMIEAHGLRDWESLEELLCCFLRVNGKNNHGFIIGAFVDLLVSLSFASCISTTTATTTATTAAASYSTPSSSSSSPFSPLSLPSSSMTTPCVSSLDQADDDDKNDEENSINVSSS